MRGSRGEQGVWTPLKNHKNIGFPSNTDLDPLKDHKATKPATSMLGHHRSTSKMPFKWRSAGGAMMVHLKWYSDPFSPFISDLYKSD